MMCSLCTKDSNSLFQQFVIILTNNFRNEFVQDREWCFIWFPQFYRFYSSYYYFSNEIVCKMQSYKLCCCGYKTLALRHLKLVRIISIIVVEIGFMSGCNWAKKTFPFYPIYLYAHIFIIVENTIQNTITYIYMLIAHCSFHLSISVSFSPFCNYIRRL